MNRTAAVAEALRVLDAALAIDNTPPNYPSLGDTVDNLVGVEILGGLYPLDYWKWTREGLAALVAVVLEHAPDDDLNRILKAIRQETKRLDHYRAELDIRARHPQMGDDEVYEHEGKMTGAERRAAVARQVLRERAHGANSTIAANVPAVANRKPPRSAPAQGAASTLTRKSRAA